MLNLHLILSGLFNNEQAETKALSDLPFDSWCAVCYYQHVRGVASKNEIAAHTATYADNRNDSARKLETQSFLTGILKK